MKYDFRKATIKEVKPIWAIIQQAIERRKNDGSDQWQDGYPNETVIRHDLENDIGYVFTRDSTIIGYAALLFNDEPEYAKIRGSWLTNGEFVVVHRLAISDKYIGTGLAQKMMQLAEDIALKNNIFSIKVDTNFDNLPMLRIFEKLGYTFCGEVSFRSGTRKAFEKNLLIN